MDVLGQGTFNVVEAAAAADVRDVPHGRVPSPLRQPDPVRRAQVVQRRTAALVQRHGRLALRGAALLQRVRPAHGRPRQVHRGPHPLDGAFGRRRPPDHLRGRQADDGLRPRGRHRARQPAGGSLCRDGRRRQHRERPGDEPGRAGPRARRGDGGGRRTRVRAGTVRQPGASPARGHVEGSRSARPRRQPLSASSCPAG
jgi:hypothetical protein